MVSQEEQDAIEEFKRIMSLPVTEDEMISIICKGFQIENDKGPAKGLERT